MEDFVSKNWIGIEMELKWNWIGIELELGKEIFTRSEELWRIYSATVSWWWEKAHDVMSPLSFSSIIVVHLFNVSST